MKYRHFGKDNQKRALLRGSVISLIKNGKIETSRVKGKDAQKMIDSLITIAKKDNLAARKRVASLLAVDRAFVSNFFEMIPSFSNRVSGYTRMIKLGKRKGDDTDMVRLEWVDDVKSTKSTDVTKGTKSKEKKTNKNEKIEEVQEVASA